MDFVRIWTRSQKKGVTEVYPKFFLVGRSSDLMIRGGDFYAVWVESRGLWSTDEYDLFCLIDAALDNYVEEHNDSFGDDYIKILYMCDPETGMVDKWHKYCQKQSRDSFRPLDEKLIFSNTPTRKEDYATKRLSYPLEPGDHTAWDKLMSTLYSEEERHKIEWAIGAIVSGDSKTMQKFMVLYGPPGTGKSTVIDIITALFKGYETSFDAKSLLTSAFGLEAFRTGPLVAIQHDGDLSRIEDNTRLNSVVSHEVMSINVKFRSAYNDKFVAFLILGTNKPVKITDANSGLMRRLIDVTPSGNKLPIREYRSTVKKIDFELGAIASYCLDVYEQDPDYYNDYMPLDMLSASNDFYNYMLDSYFKFASEDGTSLKAAWESYKEYCEKARVPHPMQYRIFKEELKLYFREFNERGVSVDGTRLRSYCSGFRKEKFQKSIPEVKPAQPEPWLKFENISSLFDLEYSDCPAQYANQDGTPIKKWANVTTTLASIDTSKLHYVRVPENHIVIDFDIPDADGNKSLALNMAEASKWPPTYAELSKSGQGIHLHYIYTGDPSKLSRVVKEHVELKVFNGNSSLRRMLTKCCNLAIAVLSSGLPMKGEKKVVNLETVKSEKALRNLIKKNLKKEIHPNTKPSIDFINKILKDAHDSGVKYNITDMLPDVINFAAGSTHNAEYCLKSIDPSLFSTEEQEPIIEPSGKIGPLDNLIIFDCEVFENLFIVCWKKYGKDATVVTMINPAPIEVENLVLQRLVGFNCLRYDDTILYARAFLGETNKQLYNRSVKIISGEKTAIIHEAKHVSYTDVYDFASKKQSLKKWEIELLKKLRQCETIIKSGKNIEEASKVTGLSEEFIEKYTDSDGTPRLIEHQELGVRWDQPVPEERWPKVAEYCANDVIATEAVFDALKSDFKARCILADLAGMIVNCTTNALTTKIIFSGNRKPQDQFNYRDLSEMFPGYTYEGGKSTYCGEVVGEGGYVYAEPGIYHDVALLDIASMHPSSIIAETLFGDTYTERFKELLDIRIAIKHKEFDKVKSMMDGKLAKYLTDEKEAKALSQALKIAINSVYGLTAAKFDNPFRDIRNIDNIVAKRGALFMVNLKHEVQKRGFTVAHIKTDSIKIPNATPEIISFVMEYGKQYGYTFEHEATYDRMCLVNDAVYIAKYKDGDWTATGTQFQVPYVFKTLFTKEPITLDDLCETKSVSTALYLDMNEGLTDGEHDYNFVGKVGLFCPIKEGKGGGILLRENNGKFDAVAGTKGYRWMEAERVRSLGKEGDVDRHYYISMVDDAVFTISKYGDFEAFVSDDKVLPDFMNIPEGVDVEVPF